MPIRNDSKLQLKSILSDIPSGIARIFALGVTVAATAEPFVDAAFPGVAQLFNAVVQQVAISEASAAAAGAGRGLGAQKLALVVRSVEGSIAEYEKKNNLTTPLTQTQVEAVTNAVVAFLNALPANAAAEDIGTLTAPVPELHVFSIR